MRWEIEQPFVASCFRNICAKNRPNPLLPFKVTIDNVGVPFLRHKVYVVICSLSLAFHQPQNRRPRMTVNCHFTLNFVYMLAWPTYVVTFVDKCSKMN